MSDDTSDLFARDEDIGRVASVISKLMASAQPGAVFGQPVTRGGYTVITASEVASGGGFGLGGGRGPAAAQAGAEPAMAGGSGGGGGRASTGRPVAVIVVEPTGVTVKPVLDFTKLPIAAITAWDAMMLAMRKMRVRATKASSAAPHWLVPALRCILHTLASCH